MQQNRKNTKGDESFARHCTTVLWTDWDSITVSVIDRSRTGDKEREQSAFQMSLFPILPSAAVLNVPKHDKDSIIILYVDSALTPSTVCLYRVYFQSQSERFLTGLKWFIFLSRLWFLALCLVWWLGFCFRLNGSERVMCWWVGREMVLKVRRVNTDGASQMASYSLLSGLHLTRTQTYEWMNKPMQDWDSLNKMRLKGKNIPLDCQDVRINIWTCR